MPSTSSALPLAVLVIASLLGACDGEGRAPPIVTSAGGSDDVSAASSGASGATTNGPATSGGTSAVTGGTTMDRGGANGNGGSPGACPSGTGGSGGAAGTGGSSGAESAGGDASAGSTSSDGGAAPNGGRGGGESTGGTSASGGAETAGSPSEDITGLSWPIDCIPDDTCANVGTPDIDDDGLGYDCSDAGYPGHEGTDIGVTWDQMDEGVAVRAAADGTVFFASDGKFDRCPDDAEPDCQRPPDFVAGDTTGTNVCTELGPYCGTGTGSCFWCFAGGNVIVVLHDDVPGVFATRYDHLKNGSVLVSPGDTVSRGQIIAEVGSAGNSTGPHLHFEVWGTGYYELADPWVGECGPNLGPTLWAHDPPWQ